MSKHTHGPWHLAVAISTDDASGAVAVVKRSIFAVFSPAARGEPDQDARLIAAAPEMLEALRDCVDSLEYLARVAPDVVGYGVRAERAAKARAAIAKAEGES